MGNTLAELVLGVDKNQNVFDGDSSIGDVVRRVKAEAASLIIDRAVPLSLTPGPYPGRPNYTSPLRPDQYQIGTVRLTVPPSKVSIQRLRDIQTTPVMRGQSMLTRAGQGIIAIDLSFDFTSIEDLNNELLPILAELKISPFTIVTSQDLASKLVELNLRELNPSVAAAAQILRTFEDAVARMENIIGTIVNRNKNRQGAFVPTREWQVSIDTLLNERVDNIRQGLVPSTLPGTDTSITAGIEANHFYASLKSVMTTALSEDAEKTIWDTTPYSSNEWIKQWLIQWDFPATVAAFNQAYVDAVAAAKNHQAQLKKLAAETSKPVTVNLDSIPTQVPLALQRVVLNTVPGHAGHFKVDMSFEVFNYKAYVDEMEFITIQPANKLTGGLNYQTGYVWTKTKEISECDPLLTWRDEKFLGIKYSDDGIPFPTPASLFLDALHSEEQLNAVITTATNVVPRAGQEVRTYSMPAFIQYMQDARQNRICRRAPIDPKKHKLILFYPNNFVALPGSSLKDQTSFYKKLELDNPEGETNTSGSFETGITTQVQVVWNVNLARQVDEWTGIVTHQFVGGSTLSASFELILPVDPHSNDHIRKVAELNRMFNTIEQNRKMAPSDGFAATTIFVRNPITELFGAYCFELSDMPMTQVDPGKIITSINIVEALPVTGLNTFLSEDPKTPKVEISGNRVDETGFKILAGIAMAGSSNKTGYTNHIPIFHEHRKVSYPFAHLIGITDKSDLNGVLFDLVVKGMPEAKQSEVQTLMSPFTRFGKETKELELLYRQALVICETGASSGINENFPSVDVLFYKEFERRELTDDDKTIIADAIREAARSIIVGKLFYGDDFKLKFGHNFLRAIKNKNGEEVVSPLSNLYVRLSEGSYGDSLVGRYVENFQERARRVFNKFLLKNTPVLNVSVYVNDALIASNKDTGQGADRLLQFVQNDLGIQIVSTDNRTPLQLAFDDSTSAVAASKRAITAQLYPDLNLPTYAQIMRLPSKVNGRDLRDDAGISDITPQEKRVFIPSFSDYGILNPSAFRQESAGIYNRAHLQNLPHRTIFDIADPDFYFWHASKTSEEISNTETYRSKESGNVVDGGILKPEFKGDSGNLITDYNIDNAEKSATGQQQITYLYDIETARIESESEPNRRRMLFAYPTFSIEFFLDVSVQPKFDSTASATFKEARLINTLPLVSLSTRLDKSLAQIAEIQFVARKAGLFNESWQFLPPTTPTKTSTFTNYPEDMLDYLRSKKSFVGNPLFLTNTLFTTGTRCTVRMGYGTDINNPRLMPVVVAGTIGELSLGEVSTIVVQSYGTQLINAIDTDIGGPGRYSPNRISDGSLTMRAFIDIFSALDPRFLGRSGRGLENDIAPLTNDEVKRIFTIGYRTRTLGTRLLNSSADFFDTVLSGLAQIFGVDKKVSSAAKNFLTNPEWVFFPEMVNVYPATTGVSDWAISNTSAKGLDASFWIDMISRLNPGTIWYPHNFGDEVRLFFGTPDQVFKAEPLPLSGVEAGALTAMSQFKMYSMADDVVGLLLEEARKTDLVGALNLKLPLRYKHGGSSAEDAVTRINNNFARRVGKAAFGDIARRFMIGYFDIIDAKVDADAKARTERGETVLQPQFFDGFKQARAVKKILSNSRDYNALLARENNDEGFADTVLGLGRLEITAVSDPDLERLGIGRQATGGDTETAIDVDTIKPIIFLIDALADAIERTELNRDNDSKLSNVINGGLRTLAEQNLRLRRALGYRKFRNTHFTASGLGLLENHLEASQARMSNHVAYNDFIIGYNVVPEERRVMSLDEDINKLNFGVFEWLKGAFSKSDKDRVLDSLIPNALARGLSYMYDGEIVLRGDPYIKPHDLVYMLDLYNGVYGPVACQTVQHSLDLASGFTTRITPLLHVEAFSNSALSDHLVANRIMRNTAAALVVGAIVSAAFLPFGVPLGAALGLSAGGLAGLAGIHDTLGKLNLKNYSTADPFVSSTSTKEDARRLIESIIYDNFVPSGSPVAEGRNVRLISPGETATNILNKLANITTPQLGVSAFPLTRIGSNKPIVAGLRSGGLVDLPLNPDNTLTLAGETAKQTYNDVEDFFVKVGTIINGTIIDARIGVSAAITAFIRKSNDIEREKKALRDRGITGLD